MKFNIAAKLGLLVALVSLVATGVVGLWSMHQARAVLTEHELADLIDEAQLRVYELMNDFRYLRRDARELANPARGGREADLKTPEYIAVILKALDKPTPENLAAAEVGCTTLLKALRRLLDRPENSYYLEVACVRTTQDHPTLLAVGRRAAGNEVKILREDPFKPTNEQFLTSLNREWLSSLLQNPNAARSSKLQTFPIRAHFVDKTTMPDGITPMLVTISSPISMNNVGMPDAMLLLTVDFEQFVRFRTRFLPRHLLYLTNEDGRLLIHPNPKRQEELRLASSGGVDKLPSVDQEKALESFAPHFQKKLGSEQQQFRRERGAAVPGVALPDVAYSFVQQRLENSVDAEKIKEDWEALLNLFLKLGERYPDLRFRVPSAASTDLQFSTAVPENLTAVRNEVLAFQKEHGWKSSGWQSPVPCKTFGIRFMLVNPDLDSRETVSVVTKNRDDEPRFFGLALATGLEEIKNDINLATQKMIWVVCFLCASAALGAWVFARYLTQPLKRIIRATQHIAEGSIDSEPPEPLPLSSKDEIGILARSFENMREQLKVRREALYETIARMKAILDTAAEGIIIFDEHGIIESFNQAAEQIFGYKASDIHGQKVDRLMAISLATTTSQTLSGTTESVRMVSQVVRTRGEVNGKRADGTTFPMEVAFSEVPLQGRKVVTGIFRDITERKKAEETIRRANEELDSRVKLRTFELEDAMGKLEAALQGAVEATKAKDSFLASMSHELRTPLNAIIGYTELLVDEAEDEGYESIVPDLRKVHSAGKHLLDLINDILDLSKIAAGQMKLSLADFEPKSLIESIQGMGKPLAQQYGNELVVEIASNLGRIHADEKRVRQILLNLLSNACKFTDKGRITLRAKREWEGEDERIILQVQDTGIGMTPEQSRRLGELFYQVDASNTRKKGGTGLGMAITKNFIRMMNGSLQIHSEPGKGTTFTVSLPVHVEQSPEAPLTDPAKSLGSVPVPNGSRDLVLVVDDDPEARDMIQRYLTKEGLRVHMIESGKDVVPLARHLRPIAITLDVRMPGLDGWTLLAALKTDPTTADIPVIMLTIEDNAKRGFALGASDYLTKPIEWPRLAAVLHKYSRAVDSAPILVVEDDAVNREMVCRMLQREGRMAVPAENGLVALERLNAGLKPALILLDLMMPEMDGFEFIDEIGRHPQLQGVPIVVVTAKELSASERERLNGSVMQVLSKGAFSPEHLISYLRERVQQHMQPSEPPPP